MSGRSLTSFNCRKQALRGVLENRTRIFRVQTERSTVELGSLGSALGVEPSAGTCSPSLSHRPFHTPRKWEKDGLASKQDLVYIQATEEVDLLLSDAISDIPDMSLWT